MHNVDLILTLAGGLSAAFVFGFITYKIGLSPIVGYLLAGVAIGKSTPGYVADHAIAEQFAEVGVVLLMFGVGLQFHFKELLAVKRVALPGAIGQSLVATLLGALLAAGAGWGWSAGLVFGLAISVASTVVLLRVLADNNHLHTPAGQIAVGWLVVEDLLTVLILVFLPAIFPKEAEQSMSLAWVMTVSVSKILLLVAFVFFAGGRAIPWLLEKVAATQSRELFTLLVLVLALGISVVAMKVFGVSMALGAFLAGMVVGQSDFSSRAAAEALPMRDAFAVLFFVAVGMLFEPHALLESPFVILATLAIILLAKPLTALGIVLLLGYPVRTALSVAVALAQIGEFSFILANLGRDLGLLNSTTNNALVAAAIVSISFNSIFYRLIGPIEKFAKSRPSLWRWLTARSKCTLSPEMLVVSDDENSFNGNEAVVIGYGPVGRTLVELLEDNGIRPTIIEMNLDTVQRLRTMGKRAVYGDGAHEETIKESGAERAIALIVSTSGLQNIEEVIRHARAVNPKIRVFARATYLREIADLKRHGADVVFAAEGEVALAMNEFLMRQLGATGEQIDRETHRIRTQLFGGPILAGSFFQLEHPTQADEKITMTRDTAAPIAPAMPEDAKAI